MKRSLALTAVLALIVSLGVSWPAEANGNPQLLTGILQKMEKAHMDLKSLKAVIMQQKVNVQINVKDTDQGTILYKPAAGNEKGKIRIDYTKPDTRIVSVVGNNFVFYQPRINQVVKTTLQQASKGKTGGYTSIIGLDGSVKNLARSYNIEYVKEETIGGEGTTQLHLTPKKRWFASECRHLGEQPVVASRSAKVCRKEWRLHDRQAYQSRAQSEAIG